MSMCVAFRKLGKASLTFHCVVLFSFFLEAILGPWSGTGLVSLSLPASSKEFKVFARFLKGLLLWKSIALVVLLCSSLLWRLTIYDLKVKSGSSTTNLGRFCQPLLQMDRSYWLVILVLVWAKPALERKMSLAHIVSELKHNTRLMCRTVTSWWNFAAAICWVLWIRILITHLTRWPPATSPVFPHARPFAVVRFLSWICSLSLSAFIIEDVYSDLAATLASHHFPVTAKLSINLLPLSAQGKSKKRMLDWSTLENAEVRRALSQTISSNMEAANIENMDAYCGKCCLSPCPLETTSPKQTMD